jgi:hypothetical protein
MSDDACWRGVVHITSVASYLAHQASIGELQRKYGSETNLIPVII